MWQETEVKRMKHAVSSYNTKKTLSTALKNAIKEKDFEKISISEVASAAGLNRKTFYYHFNDLNELLFWTLDDGVLKITKNYDLANDYNDTIHLAIEYFEKEHAFLYKIMNSNARGDFRVFLCANLREMTLKAIDDILARDGKKIDEKYRVFAAGFCTEAIAGSIMWWVSHPNVCDSATMEKYLKRAYKITLEDIIK